jgi:hypothetical protein
MTVLTKKKSSRCEGGQRHVWKVWWTQRLNKLSGKGAGYRMPYEHLTCINCQATNGRWQR